MKNPHPLSDTWSRSAISVPATTKKFKRKSREPKRLLSSPEPETIKTCQVDVDCGDGVQTEVCTANRPAPQHRRLMMSQGASASTTGLPEGGVTPTHSGGAIDMRIGINLPTVTSGLSHLPASTFSNLEISHWPVAIAQPLSGRLKQTHSSAFPLSTSANRRSPNHQAYSLESPLPVPRAPQGFENMEPQAQSPKVNESPRKRVGMSDDGPGHLPELKAIQQTRRLLANARERTRVHTISAAFEALRKQVPCYSYGQKLSKLAILRIACNYILSLAQLAEMDDGSDHSSFSQCVEQCTRTLQAEGRSKKRKE